MPLIEFGGFSIIGLAVFALVFCAFKFFWKLTKIFFQTIFDITAVEPSDEFKLPSHFVPKEEIGYTGEKNLREAGLPEQFIILSVETTSLNLETDKITEIGAVKVNRDLIEHPAFLCTLKPEMTDGEVKNDLKKLLEFIGNLRFAVFHPDEEILFRRLLQKHEVNFDNHSSCALEMTKRAFPGLPSYELGDLYSHADKPVTSRKKIPYRTIANCEMALTVYVGAASKLKSVD
ncbi:PolC-type DNA polymerase III domain-containing protein [Candidatus Mycalebacterium sp.]